MSSWLLSLSENRPPQKSVRLDAEGTGVGSALRDANIGIPSTPDSPGAGENARGHEEIGPELECERTLNDDQEADYVEQVDEFMPFPIQNEVVHEVASEAAVIEQHLNSQRIHDSAQSFDDQPVTALRQLFMRRMKP